MRQETNEMKRHCSWQADRGTGRVQVWQSLSPFVRAYVHVGVIVCVSVCVVYRVKLKY